MSHDKMILPIIKDIDIDNTLDSILGCQSMTAPAALTYTLRIRYGQYGRDDSLIIELEEKDNDI